MCQAAKKGNPESHSSLKAVETDAEEGRDMIAADLQVLVVSAQAVNTQQIVPTLETVQGLGSFTQFTCKISRIMSLGEEMRSWRMFPKLTEQACKSPKSGKGFQCLHL